MMCDVHHRKVYHPIPLIILLLVNLRKVTVLLLRLSCLSLLLLGLPLLTGGSGSGARCRLGLPRSLELEHNKVPHEPGLEEANSDERVEPDEASVEVSPGYIQGLLFSGKLGQTKPEG